MSTNKTQNYALHSWTPEDDFLRAEINENFAAIDAAILSRSKLIAGTYVGDGTAVRTIDLGYPIIALLLEDSNGFRRGSASKNSGGGLAFPGFPMTTENCTISGSEITVRADQGEQAYHTRTNGKDLTYLYLALVDVA